MPPPRPGASAAEPFRSVSRLRSENLVALEAEIAALGSAAEVMSGRVAGVRGAVIEIVGPLPAMRLGGRVLVELDGDGAGETARAVPAEIVGFTNGRALALPFAPLEGLRPGARAVIGSAEPGLCPTAGWLGRVVDALGRPLDGKGPLPAGPHLAPFRNDPPPAHRRRRVGPPLDLGVRALNAFLTCCRGQRMGLFAGSGVGKSVLLSMLARNADADVAVIGLVGERGREVQEFLEDDLGPDGLARSVVVVATSDEPALMRRQAAYTTLALAEHFRDHGRLGGVEDGEDAATLALDGEAPRARRGAQVICMIDSITRFAMAQREIGLSAGEPPTTKGYTPSVFAELPRLLERAGPGVGEGAVTGLFTVLVDGDDHDEPVADAVRGILDGHVVMRRQIAERGRYPAIDVLKSVSRTMPRACDPDYLDVVRRARAVLATYGDMEELIRLGAYRPGSSAEVDEAIRLNPALEAFLAQGKEEATSLGDGYRRLAEILA